MTAPMITRPSTEPTLDDGTGEDDIKTHVVRPSDLEEAIFNGTEITALCGYRWVPRRDPQRYPLCQPCQKKLAEIRSSGEN